MLGKRSDEAKVGGPAELELMGRTTATATAVLRRSGLRDDVACLRTIMRFGSYYVGPSRREPGMTAVRGRREGQSAASWGTSAGRLSNGRGRDGIACRAGPPVIGKSR
jgi:hypothetical protein